MRPPPPAQLLGHQMNGQKVTRGEIPGSLAMFHAADIEARLREAGVPAMVIPAIIGAAVV